MKRRANVPTLPQIAPPAVADSLITFAAVPAYLHTLYIIKRRRPSFLFAVICRKTANIIVNKH